MTPTDPEANPLAQRMQRLQELRSAWSAFSSLSHPAAGSRIATDGRALRTRLGELATDAPVAPTPESLDELDAQLDEFSDDIRDIALRLKIAQLRAALPSQVSAQRRSVLDLLDLLLAGIEDAGPGFSGRIQKVDYLITLLCAPGNDQVILHDPATLTPRLHALSQFADAHASVDPDAVEAEFFTAASGDAEGLQSELELRTMRQRKTELGLGFFAARVLRAVVTYNAALLTRLTDQAWESQDWGDTESAAPRTGTEVAAEAATPCVSGGAEEEGGRRRSGRRGFGLREPAAARAGRSAAAACRERSTRTRPSGPHRVEPRSRRAD